MKNIYYKLLLLILFITLPINNVNASSKLDLDCKEYGKVGEEITCTIIGTSDKLISSIQAKLSTSGNIEINKFTTNPIWEGSGENNSLDLYTEENKTNTFPIGTLTITIKDNSDNKNGTITIEKIYYYDHNFKEIPVSNVYKNIKILSSNNDLKTLSIEGYNITPKFNKDILEYKTTIDSEVITIAASSIDEKATITGTGKKNLKYGKNEFIITVTSEANTIKEYKLIVTRPQSLNEDNKEENKKEEKPKEEISTYEPPKEENKKEEENNSPIEEENHEKIGPLKNLSIEGYNLDFNSNIYEYNIEISNNTNKLNITTIPYSNTTTIEIEGNENLIVGKNEIIIKVNDNNNTISYKIYAHKKDDTCQVKNINIANYNLNFDCNKKDYELEIGLEDSLNITVIPTNEQAYINIYNNSNLKHEDIIKISLEVDGQEYKYNIKILKTSFELGELLTNEQIIFIAISLIVVSSYLFIKLILKKKNIIK